MKPIRKHLIAVFSATLTLGILSFTACNTGLIGEESEDSHIASRVTYDFLTPTAIAALVPGCEAAEVWVSEHSDNLPRDLQNVALLPEDYRRALFVALKPEDKANLWREQFNYFLNSGELEDDQQQRLSELLPYVKASLFVQDSPVINVFTDTSDELRKLFGKYLSKRIFNTLGSLESIDPDAETIQSASKGSSILIPPRCDCHTTSDFCDPIIGPEEGCSETEECRDVAIGCGWLWMKTCNGKCILL